MAVFMGCFFNERRRKMSWLRIVGNILLYTDTSFLTLKASGLTYLYSILVTISISSAVLFLGFIARRFISKRPRIKRFFKKIFKKNGIYRKIIHRIIKRFGYCGLIFLVSMPLAPGKEALPAIGDAFGLKFALPVCLLMNALRIAVWFRIFF